MELKSKAWIVLTEDGLSALLRIPKTSYAWGVKKFESLKKVRPDMIMTYKSDKIARAANAHLKEKFIVEEVEYIIKKGGDEFEERR